MLCDLRLGEWDVGSTCVWGKPAPRPWSIVAPPVLDSVTFPALLPWFNRLIDTRSVEALGTTWA